MRPVHIFYKLTYGMFSWTLRSRFLDQKATLALKKFVVG